MLQITAASLYNRNFRGESLVTKVISTHCGCFCTLDTNGVKKFITASLCLSRLWFCDLFFTAGVSDALAKNRAETFLSVPFYQKGDLVSFTSRSAAANSNMSRWRKKNKKKASVSNSRKPTCPSSVNTLSAHGLCLSQDWKLVCVCVSNLA